MSLKNAPVCVVAIEPMSKTLEEKMEVVKEVSKKKAASEEKKAASEKATVEDKKAASEPKEAAPTKNGNASSEKDTEPPAKTQENGVKAPALNGNKERPKRQKATPSPAVTNGVSDVSLTPSPAPAPPAADPPAEEDPLPACPEPDNDELFPELNYDETSDNECNFDSSSPEFSPVNRSVTRRSQAKKIPTPETPQLSNSKQDTLGTEPAQPASPHTATGRSTPPRAQQVEQTMPLREKVLKMKDMYCVSPRRESPGPEAASSAQKDPDTTQEPNDSKNGQALPTEGISSKTDTNFSKTRIKVSPYRRSTRISDNYSTMANCSDSTQNLDTPGDISSSSRDRSPAGDSDEETGRSPGDGSRSSYSESFRNIKGRRSYRPLREISLRNLSVQRHKAKLQQEEVQVTPAVSICSVNVTVGSELCDTVTSEASSTDNKWTPVGHVVGRKRRQMEDESPALVLSGQEAPELHSAKRARLLGYVASPFRHLRDRVASSTPILGRKMTARTAPFNTEKRPTAEESTSQAHVSIADEAMPMVADIVPGKGDGHKWCSIM